MRLYQLKEFVTVLNCLNWDEELITHWVFDNTFLDSLTGYSDEFIDFLKTLENVSGGQYELNRFDKILNDAYMRLIQYFEENPELDDNNDPIKPIISANKRLCVLIAQKYFANWEKLFKSLLADYNPINNYDMIEEDDNTVTTNVGTDTEFTNSETLKRNAFNTVTPSTVTETTGGGSNTGLKTKNEQSVVTDRTLTRSGNIGVTSSQQLIESEIQLRKRNLLDLFFIDLDKMLFLDYYM